MNKATLNTFLILVSFVFIGACSRKEDQSKVKASMLSAGTISRIFYNTATLQTEFTGINLNWLGNTGTDYVVAVIPGAAPMYEGAPINMTLTNYTPGATSATATGAASLSQVFICPAGTTHYSRIICSSVIFCP